MFSVPKLGSSLGLIGNDPKLAFRTQPSGIARLAERAPIAETDDAYWSQVSVYACIVLKYREHVANATRFGGDFARTRVVCITIR